MESVSIAGQRDQASRAVFYLLLIYYAAVCFPISTSYDVGRAFLDQDMYHLPAIMHFVSLPWDFSDYSSATTPGYHLLLAVLSQYVGTSELSLRWMNTVFGAGFIVWAGSILARRYSALMVVLLVSPALVSVYFLPAAIWLVPDNFSWVLTAGTITFLLSIRESQWRSYVVIAMLLLLAVFVRQTNVWLVPVAWVTIYFAESGRTPLSPHVWGKALAVSVPSALLLLYFIATWHGLVPPSFPQHQSVNFSTPSFFLAVFCVYIVPFLPVVYPTLKTTVASMAHRRTIAYVIVASLLLAVVVPSSNDPAHGRESGLWILAKLGPVIADRSLILIALSVAGAALLAALLLSVPKRTGVILVTAVTAFVTVYTVNRYAWERYLSMFVFIVIWLIIRELRRDPPNSVWVKATLFCGVVLNATVLVAKLLGH